MKTQLITGFTLFATLIMAGCSDDKSTTTTSGESNTLSSENVGKVQGSKYFVGELSETFNAGGYTYVNVATLEGAVWAAGPVTALKKGDKISFASKMLMKNFRSKALDRDFKEIYFAKSFTVNGIIMGATPKAGMDSNKMAGEAKKNPHSTGSMYANTQVAMLLKLMNKAENGQSIADIIANIKIFRDKTVTVRGQVTKVTPNILGTNWIHIRDNSTSQDLTITSSGTTNVGDIILAKGKLVLGKDFGKGFVMERVVDNAAIKIE